MARDARSHRHHLFWGAVCAATLAASLTTTSADAVLTVADSGQGVRGSLDDLCPGWNDSGDEVVLAGPRLAWSRHPSTEEERESQIRRLLAMLSSDQRLNIAVRGNWVAMHHAGQSAVSRRNCSEANSEANFASLTLPEPASKIAISDEGDIAALTTENKLFVAWAPSRTKQSQERLPVDASLPPNSEVADLFWHGRRLVAAGDGRMVLMRPGSREYGPEVRNIVPGRQTASAVMFGGLSYLSRNGCWDIYVGEDLRPPVRSVTCMPSTEGEPYVVASDRDLRLLTATGTEVWRALRPSIGIAQISGNTRDVGKGLLEIIEVSNRVSPLPNREFAPFRPGSTVEPWTKWLPTEAWSSTKGADEAMSQITARGWASLQADGMWWAGDGVAATWANASDFVNVRGRSLEELGKELTPAGRFSDAQISQIIERNRSLRRSLEGELITRGWVPIGALLGTPTQLPESFDILSALRKEASQNISRDWHTGFRERLSECDAGGPGSPENELSALLKKGLEIAGGLDRSLGRSLGQPTGAQLMADGARVINCPGGLQLVAVNDASLAANRDGGYLILSKAVVDGTNGRTYRPSDNAGWPVKIDGVAVIGAKLDPRTASPAWRGDLTRSWLDRIIRYHPRLDRLSVPVVALRIAFAGDVPAISRQLKANDHLTVLSAEASPSRPRAVYCRAATAQEAIRAKQEALMELDAVDLQNRAVGSVQIAIFENEMDVLNPAFLHDDGKESVWWLVDEHGEPQKVRLGAYEARATRTDDEFIHGTAVAGVIVGRLSPRGVLPGMSATWVDLLKSPAAHRDLFSRLVEKGAIINLSHMLARNWGDLEQSAAGQDWSTSVLIVAAARNAGELDYGMPITWKTTLNVIGVGVVDATKAIPKYADYGIEYVDLLAPGEDVVSLAGQGQVTCSGTSFATAYVSAVTALLAQRVENENRELSAARLRARLLATATWDRTYRSHVKGGLVNVRQALENINENVLSTIEEVNSKKTEGPSYRIAMPDSLTNKQLRFDGVRALGPGIRTQRPVRIPWFNVLRIQYTHDVATKPAYRISIIDPDGRYQIFEDATFQDPEAAIPMSDCKPIKATTSNVTCKGTASSAIYNFIRRYPARLEINAF